MSTDDIMNKQVSRKYAVKIFEPFVEMGYALDIPLTEDSIDEDVLREEINSFVFEQLDSGANVPFQYAVHKGENGDEIWLMLGKFADQSADEHQSSKSKIESLNKKHAAKVRSLESRLEAELLTKDVEYEEKEIALQKEVITLRLKHAKDTAELRNKVTEYEEKIKTMEAQIANFEKNCTNL